MSFQNISVEVKVENTVLAFGSAQDDVLKYLILDTIKSFVETNRDTSVLFVNVDNKTDEFHKLHGAEVGYQESIETILDFQRVFDTTRNNRVKDVKDLIKNQLSSTNIRNFINEKAIHNKSKTELILSVIEQYTKRELSDKHIEGIMIVLDAATHCLNSECDNNLVHAIARRYQTIPHSERPWVLMAVQNTSPYILRNHHKITQLNPHNQLDMLMNRFTTEMRIKSLDPLSLLSNARCKLTTNTYSHC